MYTGRAPYFLQDAMELVLRECPGHIAEQGYLYKVIRERELYWQLDGTPLERSQIGARASHYPHMFEKIPANKATGTRAKIRLLR